MGIHSTRKISRKDAINRILFINDCCLEKDYLGLEQKTFEHESGINLKQFVDSYSEIDVSNIDRWTNYMLEEVIDLPFFRNSMFDNYVIREEGECK